MTEDEYIVAPLKDRLSWEHACSPNGPCSDRLLAKSEIERLESLVAKLSVALKPFAEESESWKFHDNEERLVEPFGELSGITKITVGDLREAHKVLGEIK